MFFLKTSSLLIFYCALIYILNFIIGVCIGKNRVYLGFGTIHSLRHPPGVLHVSPMEKVGGLL